VAEHGAGVEPGLAPAVDVEVRSADRGALDLDEGIGRRGERGIDDPLQSDVAGGVEDERSHARAARPAFDVIRRHEAGRVSGSAVPAIVAGRRRSRGRRQSRCAG
jgi:hypothetical protein